MSSKDLQGPMLQNANGQASHYIHDRRINLHFQRNFVPGPYDRHRPRPAGHDPLLSELGSVRTSKGVVSGVHVEPFGHTRVIRLAKANSHNMLDGETCRELIKLLLNMEENPAVKAVVLKGRDQQLFTAGTDFADLHTRVEEAQKAGLPPSKAMEVARLDYVLQWLVHTYTKPLVVGTHGLTGSAGLALALNSRFGYSTPSTKVVLPEVSLGLAPGSGLTYALSRTRGGVGMYMALTGAAMRGDELVASGMLSYQTTHELLEAEVPQAMSHAAAGSPLAPFELEKDIHARNALAERRENYMELKSDLIDEQMAELDVDQVERYKLLQTWRTLGKLGRKDLADKVLKATDEEPVLPHELAPVGTDFEDGEAEAFFMEGHENSYIHGVNDHNEPLAVTMKIIGDSAGLLPHQVAHSEQRTMEDGAVPDAIKAKLAAIERTFGGVPGLGDPVMTVSDRTLPFRGGGSMLRPPPDTVREAREAKAAEALRAQLAATDGPEALTGRVRAAAQAKLDLLEQHPYANDPWRRTRSTYWLARLEASGSLSAQLPADWASEAALGRPLGRIVLDACYEVNETRRRSGDQLRAAVEKLVPSAWPRGWASEEEVARVCDEVGLLPDTAPQSTGSAALPDHPASYEAAAASDEQRHGREAVRVAASMVVARLHKVPPMSLVPEEAAAARRAREEQQRLSNAKMRSAADAEPASLRWHLERILRNPMNHGTTAHPSHGGQATSSATAKLAPAAELSAAALEALYSPAGAPSTVPALADKLRGGADFRSGLAALAGRPGAADSPLAMAFPAAIATLRAQAAAASGASGSGGELLVGSAKDALAWLEEAGADLQDLAAAAAPAQQPAGGRAAEELAALGRRLAALADPAAALQEAREFALEHAQTSGRSGTLAAMQQAGLGERVHPKVLARLAEAQEAQSGTPALADEPASSGRLMGEFRLEGLSEVGRQLARSEVRALLTAEEVSELAAARAELRRVEAEAPAGGALLSERAAAQRALGAAMLRPAERLAREAAVPAARLAAAARAGQASASAEERAAAAAVEAHAAAGAATPTEVAGLKALGGDAKSVAVDAAPASAGFVSSEGLLPRLKSVVEAKATEAKALVEARRDALRVEAMWAAAARAALPATAARTASAVAEQVAQLKAAAGDSAVPPQPADADAVSALAEAAAAADPLLSDAAIAEAVGLWPALEAAILQAGQLGAKATEDARVRLRAGTRAAEAASRAQQLGEASAVPLERTVSQLTTEAAGQSVAAALMARAAFGRLVAEGAATPTVESAAAELTAAARRFVASQDPLTPAQAAASTSWLSRSGGQVPDAEQLVAMPPELTLGAFEGTAEEEAAVRRLADRRGVSAFATSARDSLHPEALQERLPAGVKYVAAQPGRFDPAEVLEGEKSILDARDNGAMSALSDPELAKGVQRVIRQGRTTARRRMGLVGAAGPEPLPEHPYESTEEPLEAIAAVARDLERDVTAWQSGPAGAEGGEAADPLFGAEADGWSTQQVAVDAGAPGAEAVGSSASGLTTEAARRATSLRGPTAYGYSWQRDTSTHGAAAADPRGLLATQRPTDELVMRDLARTQALWQERAILGGRREASAMHRALDHLEAAADSATRAAGDDAAIALAGFDQAVLERYLTGLDVSQRSRLGAGSGSRYPSLEAADSGILQASAGLRRGSDSLGASALDSVDLAAYRPALKHEVEVASAAEVDPEAFVRQQLRGAWHEREPTPAPRLEGEAHTAGPLVSGGASTTGSSVPDQAALRLARGDADAANRAAANAAADPTVPAEATAALLQEAQRQAARVADLERLADPARPLTAREQWVAELLTASPVRAEALASLGWAAADVARALSVKAAAAGRPLEEAAPAAAAAEVASKAAAALAAQGESAAAAAAAERLAGALEAADSERHPVVQAVAALAAAPTGSADAAAALTSLEEAVGDATAARVLRDSLAGDSAAAEAALASAQPALLQQLAVATRRVHSLASSRLAAMVPGGWRGGLSSAVGSSARSGQPVRRQLDRMRRGVEPAIGGVARQQEKAAAAVVRAEKSADASVVAAAEEAAAAAAAAAGGPASSSASSRLDRLLADLAAKPEAKKAAAAKPAGKGKLVAKAAADAAAAPAAAAAASGEPAADLWAAVDARLPPQLRSPALRRLALLDPARARELVQQEAAGSVDPALAAEVAARAVGEWSRADVEAAQASASAATEAQLDTLLSTLGPKLTQLRQAGAEGLLADMYRTRGPGEVSDAAGVVSGVSASSSLPWSGPTLSAGAAAHVSARSLGLLAADQELLQPAGMHDPEADEHADVSRLVTQQRVDAQNAVADVDPRLDEAGWLDGAEQPVYTTVGGLRVPVRPWQWRDRDIPAPTDAEMAQITHDPRALLDALRFPDRVPPPVQRAAVEATLRFQDIDAWRMSVPQARSVEEIKRRLRAEDSPFARRALRQLEANPALAVRVTHRLIAEGSRYTLAECMAAEFRANARLAGHSDFAERGGLLARGAAPGSVPPVLSAEPTEEEVAGLLAPLDDPEAELVLARRFHLHHQRQLHAEESAWMDEEMERVRNGEGAGAAGAFYRRRFHWVYDPDGAIRGAHSRFEEAAHDPDKVSDWQLKPAHEVQADTAKGLPVRDVEKEELRAMGRYMRRLEDEAGTQLHTKAARAVGQPAPMSEAAAAELRAQDPAAWARRHVELALFNAEASSAEDPNHRHSARLRVEQESMDEDEVKYWDVADSRTLYPQSATDPAALAASIRAAGGSPRDALRGLSDASDAQAKTVARERVASGIAKVHELRAAQLRMQALQAEAAADEAARHSRRFERPRSQQRSRKPKQRAQDK